MKAKTGTGERPKLTEAQQRRLENLAAELKKAIKDRDEAQETAGEAEAKGKAARAREKFLNERIKQLNLDRKAAMGPALWKAGYGK